MLRRCLALVTLALPVLSGCKIFGGRPAPEGLADVKSVGKAGEEWKDARGGLWRLGDKRLDWEDAESSCRRLAVQAKKRWRLPSPEELVQARAEGISQPAKNKAFGWVSLSNTWTAEWETGLDEEINGVYIDMSDGRRVSALSDDLEHTTVCVRSDSQGSTWADGKGSAWWYLDVKMPFETAEVSCQELAKRRQEAWRLPTSDELTAAVKNGIQTDQNKAFGRDYLTLTWSGQVAAILDSEEAFAIDLRNGRSHLTDVDEDLSVLCVKSDTGTQATAGR